jgi:hypothetical protein
MGQAVSAATTREVRRPLPLKGGGMGRGSRTAIAGRQWTPTPPAPFQGEGNPVGHGAA